MDKFVGKWKLESTENFDEYLAAAGVGYVMRKMASTLKPDLVFIADGESYKMRTESTFKNTEIIFKLAEEFDEVTADGRKMKTTMSLDGTTLTQTQKGNVDSTLTRELTDDDTIKLVCKANDVESTRIYGRIKS